ncbi:hypothetical protein L0244_21050, partial [bacterium]|nr:hypothetical protein [bacterium]
VNIQYEFGGMNIGKTAVHRMRNIPLKSHTPEVWLDYASSLQTLQLFIVLNSSTTVENKIYMGRDARAPIEQ